MGRGQASVDAAVERTISESALAGERILSIARLVFLGLLLSRSPFSLSVSTNQFERAVISYPAQAVAIAFSIAILCGLGRRRTNLVLHISAAIDVVVGFLVLLPNALWSGPAYRGTPFMIDTTALIMLIVATGLRQSTTVVALGSVLVMLALGGLALVDHFHAHVDAASLGVGYTIYAVLLAAVAALSLMIAVRTRRLVETAARAAVVADKAEHGLRAVLHDHHDLRTVITSAQINADLLSRGSSGDNTLDDLREDLGELRTQLDQVKTRALEEILALEKPAPVALDAVLAEVASALSPRFPAVSIQTSPVASRSVMVAGGAPTLRRVVVNLVVNACEGDGKRGARSVEMSVRDAAAGRVAVEIADDGPGLPGGLRPGEAPSTKAAGTGIGMQLVDGLVRASGGTVTWGAREGGGTRVIVDLAAAEMR